MISVVRKVSFCAGHRVLGHEGRCATMHGHNYVTWFHASAETLDPLGRVIDFAVLKSKLGGWIDEHWDHAFLVFEKDKAAQAALAHIPGQRLFVLPVNPSAENLAHYLLREVCPQVLVGTGVQITKVVLWETENCYAEAALEK